MRNKEHTMPRTRTNAFRDATAEELAAIADIRHRPAYGVCRWWLDRAIAESSRPFTETLRLDVQSVTILLKGYLVWVKRGRPFFTAAFEDPDADYAVALALADAGAMVGTARDSTTGKPKLACNFSHAALVAAERDMKRSVLFARDRQLMEARRLAKAAARGRPVH
jgi:hypothetical protein